MSTMTRADVERIVSEARAKGERTDLYGANLRGADLRGADLYGADLRAADLYGADLYGADLRAADLYGADLYGANLRGANLYGADLYGAHGGVLSVTGLPSGPAILVPTCDDGWHLRIGCWTGTVQGLRDLIAGDDWPEAEGAEQERRRPGLTALADLCDAHATAHADELAAVVARWGVAS